jgi:hypothetical protein
MARGPYTIGLALAAARKLRAAGIIHRSAWKVNSQKLAQDYTEGYDVLVARSLGKEKMWWTGEGHKT